MGLVMMRPGRSARLGVACAAALLLAQAGAALQGGQAAPAFTAPLLTGAGDVSLADHRGKVVYLDFWASWCPPCLTSMPLLDGLREEFGTDFQVLAVNVDRDPERARRFLSEHPVGYPSASDPEGRLPERYEVGTMPTAFLIDRDGVIRHVHEGFRRSDVESLRRHIRELLSR